MEGKLKVSATERHYIEASIDDNINQVLEARIKVISEEYGGYVQFHDTEEVRQLIKYLETVCDLLDKMEKLP